MSTVNRTEVATISNAARFQYHTDAGVAPVNAEYSSPANCDGDRPNIRSVLIPFFTDVWTPARVDTGSISVRFA